MNAYTIAAVLMFGAATGMGQQSKAERPYLHNTASYNDVNVQKVSKNFLAGLQSTNHGVVESAIAQVAYMRGVLPVADLTDIEITVNALATNGRTPVIRYKAYLASLVFANPLAFSQQTAVDYTSADEFFSALNLRLQQTLLGYGGK